MSKMRNQEALTLSEEILHNFELSEIPSQKIILKCIRLARILNDMDSFQWLKCEAKGFDTNSNGLITAESWKLASRSGRHFFKKEKDDEKAKVYAFVETIADMEASIDVLKKRMEVAYDPGISVSSHSQFNPVISSGNAIERNSIANTIRDYTRKIEKIKTIIYEYVVNVNYELKFGNIMEDIFTRKRNNVDTILVEVCPDAVKKFISIYDNINSNNDEDWANAVHSCRRILKEVADKVYPPKNEPIMNKGDKIIKIGEDEYINRLMIYIEGKSESKKFKGIVGSHLKYIGERLDSICEAANKGSHHKVSLEEAERYIIYTYLILGDVLSL